MKLHVFFLLISTISFSQNVPDIHFEYRDTQITIAHAVIKDSVYISSKDSIPIYIKSERLKLNKVRFISKEYRKKIVDKVSLISSTELIKDFAMGADGSNTRIVISNMFNFISFDIWGLSLKNKKNGSFREAVLLILEAAEIDPKSLYR